MKKRFMDYLVYLIVRILFCTVQSLSLKTGQQFAKVLAIVLTDIIPVRRKLLYSNLQIAFPDLTNNERHRLIRSMWQHLVLMGIEISLANRKIRDTNWTDHIELIDAEPLLDLLHQDRPLILVTGHFGNFEIGGFTLGVLSHPSHSVARTLDNPYLNRFIKNFRESTGQYLIPKKGGADDIIHVLENNGLMAFLTDQAASKKDCTVDFFGKPAQTFKAIAVTALQYKAPIVVCYALRKKNDAGVFLPMRFEVHINGVLDTANLPPDIRGIKDITQWYTQKLEDGIRCASDQYWWIHNRWKRKKELSERDMQQ